MGEAVGRDDHIVDSIPGDGRHAHKCETNPGGNPDGTGGGIDRPNLPVVTRVVSPQARQSDQDVRGRSLREGDATCLCSIGRSGRLNADECQ
jgi:hypothetical protein